MNNLQNLWGRFKSKFAVNDETSCWEWFGAKSSEGYGEFWYQGRFHKAHRISWMMTNGPIPDGLVVRHVACRNRICVNPDHLALGTHADNVEDRQRDGTTARGERCGAARLTDQIVLEARSLHSEGISYRALGRKYNVDHKTIMKAVNGVTWMHVG